MLQTLAWTGTNSAVESAPDDLVLVAGLQRGEAWAVEHAVRRYAPVLYRFVYYRVQDAGLAEDLVSEVFVRLLGKVGGYVQGSTPFQAWLFQIARNLIADHYRARRRRPQVSFEQCLTADPALEPASTEAGFDRLADRDLLARGLAALTAEQRQVILLHVVEGWELPEVARQVGRTLASVKCGYYRGLHALRRHLDRQAALEGAGRP